MRTLRMQRFAFSFSEGCDVKLICVVRDRLSESVGPVMVFPAVPAAIRSFSDLALDPSTMVHRHAADFDLLHVASIEEGSGEVTPLSPPVVLLSGVQWLASQARADSKPEQLSLMKEA